MFLKYYLDHFFSIIFSTIVQTIGCSRYHAIIILFIWHNGSLDNVKHDKGNETVSMPTVACGELMFRVRPLLLLLGRSCREEFHLTWMWRWPLKWGGRSGEVADIPHPGNGRSRAVCNPKRGWHDYKPDEWIATRKRKGGEWWRHGTWHWQPFCSAKPKGSICSLFKWAYTAFWFYTAALRGVEGCLFWQDVNTLVEPLQRRSTQPRIHIWLFLRGWIYAYFPTREVDLVLV